MQKVIFLLNKDSVTLHYDGKSKVIAKGDERFEKVLSAIREKRNADIPSIVEGVERKFKEQGLDIEDGVLTVEGEAMPTELSNRIVEYKKHSLPFDSLLKFWDNLKQNPSFNSRKQLFKFLENKGHAITEDGYFTGYRGVTEDFKDRHTKTFNNAPGAICSIPRAAVDDNPNNTCSHGLHVGGYDYAKDFGKDGKLVMVKVHPRDVVAVPNDYNGQKMRVCRFEVMKETVDFEQAPVVAKDGGKYVPTSSDLAKRPGLAAGLKAHKAQYANNHAKRGPDGKFIAKKKSATKKTARKGK